jgi:hypothetical protein
VASQEGLSSMKLVFMFLRYVDIHNIDMATFYKIKMEEFYLVGYKAVYSAERTVLSPYTRIKIEVM